MATVRLRLLGQPRVEYDDRTAEFAMEKRWLLLAYLACQDGWVERDLLADLFWPEVEQHRARTNLRQLSKRARAYPFAYGVEFDARALRWNVASDLNDFRRPHDAGAWAHAVAIYRGDLLVAALLTAP